MIKFIKSLLICLCILGLAAGPAATRNVQSGIPMYLSRADGSAAQDGDIISWSAANGWWYATAGGFAPNTPKYWTSEASGDLSAEINLGALTTGLLKHTVAAGVSTPATALVDTDYAPPVAGTYTLGKSTGCSTVAAALATIATAGNPKCILVIPSGAWPILVDTTIPSNVHLRFLNGGRFSVQTVAFSGTATCTWTSVAIGKGFEYLSTTPYIKSADSSALPANLTGRYIKTAGGAYYQVALAHDSTGAAHLTNYPAAEAVGAYTYCPAAITGTLLDEFQDNDIMYVVVGGSTYAIPVAHVTDANNIMTHTYIPREFAALATPDVYRSIRVIIEGGITAGRYQIFEGATTGSQMTGVVKFKGGQREVCPEWWGAKADGDSANATINAFALNRAQYAFTSILSNLTVSGVVSLNNGTYIIDGPICLVGASMYGTGGQGAKNNSTIRSKTGGFEGLAMLYMSYGSWGYGSGSPSGSKLFKLSDFVIYCDGAGHPNDLDMIGILQLNGGYCEISNVHFEGCSVAYHRMEGNIVHFDKCSINACDNGFFTQSVEGMITNCRGVWGKQLINSPTIADGTYWLQSAADWTIAGGKATKAGAGTGTLYQNVMTNGAGGLGALDGKTIRPNAGYIVIKVSYTCTAGACDVWAFGRKFSDVTQLTAVTGTQVIYYVKAVTTTSDMWSYPNCIEFIPTDAFRGTIEAAYTFYGTAVKGAMSLVSGNNFWSDGPSGAVGIDVTGINGLVANNSIHPAAVGAVLGSYSSRYRNNYLYGIIGAYFSCTTTDFQDNSLQCYGTATEDVGYCLYASNITSGVVTKNKCQPDTGGLVINDTLATGTFICEDNYGIDLLVTAYQEIYRSGQTFNDTWKARHVMISSTYSAVAPTSPTRVDNFGSALPVGKELYIHVPFVAGTGAVNPSAGHFYLNYSNSGGTSYLVGNNNVDYHPVSGDIIRAVKGEDGKWNCSLISGFSTPVDVAYNPASINTGAGLSYTTLVVPGAAMGDLVLAAPPVDMAPTGAIGVFYSTHVTGVNSVTLRLWNRSGDAQDIASGTWKYQVIPKKYATYVEAFDMGNVNNGTVLAQDFTVPGAALGDVVYATCELSLTNMDISASVTAANTVTVVLSNNSGAARNIASTNWRIYLVPKARLKPYLGYAGNSDYITYDPPAINTLTAVSTTTAAIGNAVLGDFVLVGPGVDILDTLNCGYVSANGTITILTVNETAANIADGDILSSSWSVWRGTGEDVLNLFKQ